MQRKKLTRENFDPFGDGGGLYWGGDEVLRWLKKYVNVERCGADMSVYLIDPSAEDRVGFGYNGAKPRPGDKSVTGRKDRRSSGRDGGMDPVTKVMKEARWQILEKLSRVSTFTRRTVQAVAEDPRVPPQVRRLMKNPEVQTLQEEFDSARIYLARWAMGVAEQSERERKARIWTAQDVLEMEESAVGDFEILELETGSLSLRERSKPVTLQEWNGFFDAHAGTLQVTPDEVKERIFHGGLDPDDGVRKEAWLFLLGVYGWDSSREERRVHLNSLRDEYIRLKGEWWDRLGSSQVDVSTDEYTRDQKNRIGMA